MAFVLPNGVAMAAGWFGDNSGPPEVNATQEDYLRKANGLKEEECAFSRFRNFRSRSHVKGAVCVTQPYFRRSTFTLGNNVTKSKVFSSYAGCLLVFHTGILVPRT